LKNLASEVSMEAARLAGMSAQDQARIAVAAADRAGSNSTSAIVDQSSLESIVNGINEVARAASIAAGEAEAHAARAEVHAAEAKVHAAVFTVTDAPTTPSPELSNFSKELDALRLEREKLHLERERVEYEAMEREKAARSQAVDLSDAIGKISKAVQESSDAVQRNSEAVANSSEVLKRSSGAVLDHAEALKTSSDAMQKSSYAIQENTESLKNHSDVVKTSSDVVRENMKTVQIFSNAVNMSIEAHAEAVKTIAAKKETVDEVSNLSKVEEIFKEVMNDSEKPKEVKKDAETKQVVKKDAEEVSKKRKSAVTDPDTDKNQTTSGPTTAKELEVLGPGKSAALINSLQAELAKEKRRLARDEKVLGDAVAKLSSGKPFADFVAGMDTGEVPRDGLSEEQLANMTIDTEHVQFALTSTVNILGNTLKTLGSGKPLADAVFGSDTSDLLKPHSSFSTPQSRQKDAFDSMDLNSDGSIQRREWDKGAEVRKRAVAQQVRQTNEMCSPDDLRQVFLAMDQTCQASVGRAFISDVRGTSEGKVKELCPCIHAAIPRLGEAFLRKDCMPTGTTPLSKLCYRGAEAQTTKVPLPGPQQTAVVQPSATRETAPVSVPTVAAAVPLGGVQESLPSQMSPSGSQQDHMEVTRAATPQCQSADLESLFKAMDDKCQSAVGNNFVTTPLVPAPELKSLCSCVTAATKKLGVKDCAPPGGPSFQMICDNALDDDTDDQDTETTQDSETKASDKLEDSSSKAASNSFGERLMKAVSPDWSS